MSPSSLVGHCRLGQVAQQPTYYDVLEISPAATADQVRTAYLAMARKFHPDFFAQQPEEIRAQAESRMQLVNQAATVLGDSARRRRYDDELRAAGRLPVTTIPGNEAAPAARRRGRVPSEPSTVSARPTSEQAVKRRGALSPSTMLLVVSVALVLGGALADIPPVMLGGMAIAALAAILTLRAGAST